MCGIAGLVDLKGNFILNKNKILNLMHSRGPDEKGYYKNQTLNYKLHLFHSRLTIIDDNKRSNQPYKFKNYIMVYNGELYNYKELKNKLEKFNYKFSQPLTRKYLLKLMINGEKCFEFFDGMWSACIYDTKKNELVLSGDIFVKNLYIFIEIKIA